jgi:hypothetical protein
MTAKKSIAESISLGELPQTSDFVKQKELTLSCVKRFFDGSWSNFNESDPGITIMEQLVYGLTELGYCNDFPVEDVLSNELGQLEIEDIFLKPDEALMSNTVTDEDLTKVILDQRSDVAGVYIYPEKIELNNGETECYTGRYKVKLATHQDLPVEQRNILLKEVQAILVQQRFIASSFSSIEILRPKKVTLQGEFGIADSSCAFQVMQDIRAAIDSYLLPQVAQSSYETLQDSVIDISTIFDGPRMNNAWLSNVESQMVQCSRIKTSDIAAIISRVEGVTTVGNLTLIAEHKSSNDSEKPCVEILIQASEIPRILLDPKKFIAQRNGIEVEIPEQPSTKSYINNLLQRRSKESEGSLYPALPQGKYRNLGEYYSAQNTFPLQYATGPNGLPAGVSEYRIAQMRQLKGYLTLSDRLIADQFAQLEHIPKLLSFRLSDNNHEIPTYSTGSLESITGIEELLSNDYSNTEQLYTHNRDELRNNILDHLLARHGEWGADIESIIPVIAGLQNDQRTSVIIKSLWLQNTAILGYHRNRGFDYLNAKTLSTPGRYRIADNYAELLLDTGYEIKQVSVLQTIHQLGYSSREALKQAVIHATGLSDLYEILPVLDGNIDSPEFDPFINGKLNVSQLEKNEKIKTQDIDNFSAFELRLNLLTGLCTHYRLVAGVLHSLMNNDDFNCWLNADSISHTPFIQSEESLPKKWNNQAESDLEICVEAENGQHKVYLSQRLLLTLVSKEGEPTISVYQQHSDQLTWLSTQRKGSVFIELMLLLTSSEMTVSDMNSNKLKQTDCYLKTTLLLPSYLAQINSSEFQQSIEKVVNLYLPANVHNTTRFLSFLDMSELLPNFCNWHNGLKHCSTNESIEQNRDDMTTAGRYLLKNILSRSVHGK